jgi:hypothetical protein
MDWDKQGAHEWDNLGFYYEHDPQLHQWRLMGSKKQLLSFAGIIKSYASCVSNNEISEHMHLGPHNYLKIMTWSEPVISDNYIAGSLSDLNNLGILICANVENAVIGNVFKIDKDYSLKNTSSLLFFVLYDDFVPSSIEFD